jgi:hypothetical protein
VSFGSDGRVLSSLETVIGQDLIDFDSGWTTVLGFFTVKVLEASVPSLTDYVDNSQTVKQYVDSQLVSAGTVKTLHVSLTASQLKSLNSSPVEIIPAPGAGRILNVIAAVGKFTTGVEAFDQNNSDAVLAYAGDPTNPISLEFGPDGTALVDQLSVFEPINIAINTVGVSNMANQNVSLVATSDAGPHGDGTFEVWIWYTVTSL